MHKIFSALLLAMLAFNPVIAQEAEDGDVPTYGDWGKVCEEGPAGEDGKSLGEVCYIFQNVTNKDNGKMVMQVRIGLASNSKQPVMIVTLPLGVLIPSGAALMMDGIDPLKLPFLACAPEGCTTVGQPLSDAMIAAMKKGDQAQVRVALLNRKVLSLPVSLKGFTRATVALSAGK